MIIEFPGIRENCGEQVKMIGVKIELELVESLVSETSTYTGTVLLCELRDTMQDFLEKGLMRGCMVSVRASFQHAWKELVIEESSDDSMSLEEM